MLYYGLTNYDQAFGYAFSVASVFAPLGQATLGTLMLLETTAAETGLGSILDPNGAFAGVGVGLCQFDKIGFDDVKQNLKEKHKKVFLHYFGVNPFDVELRDLAMSPLLSFMFCRLKYARVPAPIPTTLKGRAEYWKKYYNSYAPTAAGTPAGYIKKARHYMPYSWPNWCSVANG